MRKVPHIHIQTHTHAHMHTCMKKAAQTTMASDLMYSVLFDSVLRTLHAVTYHLISNRTHIYLRTGVFRCTIVIRWDSKTGYKATGFGAKRLIDKLQSVANWVYCIWILRKLWLKLLPCSAALLFSFSFSFLLRDQFIKFPFHLRAVFSKTFTHSQTSTLFFVRYCLSCFLFCSFRNLISFAKIANRTHYTTRNAIFLLVGKVEKSQIINKKNYCDYFSWEVNCAFKLSNELRHASKWH